MATKTFKIGEYCKGGIITAIATEKKVTLIGKEWDTTKGYNKGSDQSNAKEFTRLEVDPSNEFSFRRMDEFLCDLTTNYYACEVIKWVESVVKVKNGLFC